MSTIAELPNMVNSSDGQGSDPNTSGPPSQRSSTGGALVRKPSMGGRMSVRQSLRASVRTKDVPTRLKSVHSLKATSLRRGSVSEMSRASISYAGGSFSYRASVKVGITTVSSPKRRKQLSQSGSDTGVQAKELIWPVLQLFLVCVGGVCVCVCVCGVCVCVCVACGVWVYGCVGVWMCGCVGVWCVSEERGGDGMG